MYRWTLVIRHGALMTFTAATRMLRSIVLAICIWIVASLAHITPQCCVQQFAAHAAPSCCCRSIVLNVHGASLLHAACFAYTKLIHNFSRCSGPIIFYARCFFGLRNSLSRKVCANFAADAHIRPSRVRREASACPGLTHPYRGVVLYLQSIAEGR